MNKFVRVDGIDDPDRCTVESVECGFKAVPGTDRCYRHGANLAIEGQIRDREQSYLLHKWEKRVSEFSVDPEIKQLHQEVGIMRMMLEEILGQCGDAHELLIHSAKITMAVDKIQKLVETIDRMDARQAIYPQDLTRLATEWVKIINIYITDPDALDQLSDRLAGTLEHVQQ